MDYEYWAGRWKSGGIGFHEGRANAFLEKHLARLGEKRRVLVPLCGRAEDMAYLASCGHEVIGIEAFEDAVRDFWRNHDLTPTISEVGGGAGSNSSVRKYSAKGITIFAGDVFACTSAMIGSVNAIYDRAALVALPPDVRPRYAAHLRSLLDPGSNGLILTFVYAQEKTNGPPFSVNEGEVRSLFAGSKTLEKIDAAPSTTTSVRFKELGIDVIEECFFMVT